MEQSNTIPKQAPWSGQEHDHDEISLTDILITLGEQKRWVFAVPTVLCVLVAIVSLLMPPVFSAKTSLVPPTSGGSGGAAALLGSLGGLAGLAGVSVGGGNSEAMIGILKSRSTRDILIDEFKLMEYYGLDSREKALEELSKAAMFSLDKKSNLITIEVEDKDPEMAARLANAYYAALRNIMNRVAVTEAQQRRQFFEEQFAKAKEDLSNAEVRMKETSERTGLIELKSQAEASIQALARLKAEIAQREVQLSAMRTFATDENANVRQLLAELSGLRAQLKKMEGGAANQEVGFVNAGNLPKQGLEYVRAFREVKYQEAIFEIMAKQFELAKVDEAKDGGNVQQLDVAIPPEKRSKPKRSLMVVAAGVAGLLLGVVFAFIAAAMQRARANPESSAHLLKLRKAWQLR